MKNGAFTLAEVLLTLAIIGVVAALTIPAVIIKVQKDQYVVALKKAYNTLSTIEATAVREAGSRIELLKYTSRPFYEIAYKPYIDVLKGCGLATDQGCFAEQYYELRGTAETLNFANQAAAYKIITPDGIAYSFQIINQYNPAFPERRVGIVYVDVNGPKGPNTYGRDAFRFEIYWNKSIKPMGYNVTGSFGNCKANGTGDDCTAKVLSEGAMNY